MKSPDLYLGGTIGCGYFDGIGEMWFISAYGYLDIAIPQIEEHFDPLPHLSGIKLYQSQHLQDIILILMNQIS